MKMTGTIGLSNVDVELERSKIILDQVNKLPLMESPIPVMGIFLAYIVFVLKMGPDYMKNRVPFRLKYVMLTYNLIQVVLSAYLFIRFLSYMWRTDFLFSKCNINNIQFRNEILIHIWLYHVVKISDLLDTVFFVLRKKTNQITFLHVYHHSLMVVGSWLFLKYVPSETVIFSACLNALIHFFMYGYYGLTALGPHMAPYLTWKKYLTAMQLVQFVSQIIHFLVTLRSSECPPSSGVAIFILINLMVFVALFSNFYRKRYNRKDKSVLSGDDSCVKARSS